jgi:hypothetical protein
MTLKGFRILWIFRIQLKKRSRGLWLSPASFFSRQVICALFGLLGLLFVACGFRAALLFSNTPTATIAFLVCHFPSPPFGGLKLLGLILYRELLSFN